MRIGICSAYCPLLPIGMHSCWPPAAVRFAGAITWKALPDACPFPHGFVLPVVSSNGSPEFSRSHQLELECPGKNAFHRRFHEAGALFRRLRLWKFVIKYGGQRFYMTKSMVNTHRNFVSIIMGPAIKQSIYGTLLQELCVFLTLHGKNAGRDRPAKHTPTGSHRRCDCPNTSIYNCGCPSYCPIRPSGSINSIWVCRRPSRSCNNSSSLFNKPYIASDGSDSSTL